MSQIIQRYQIADYLNVGTDKETYELMGAGFNTLDENPAAQLDTKNICEMTVPQHPQSKVIKRNFHTIQT